MDTLEVQEFLQSGLNHHQAGQLSEAEALYRQILNKQPYHAQALHLLGVIAHQNGEYDQALDLIGKACAIDNSVAEFHCNRGLAWEAKGNLSEATACYQKAIQILPSFAAAYYNLGNAYAVQKKIDQAIASYQKAIELDPSFSNSHNNLGNLLRGQDKLEEALTCYQKASELNPRYAEAHHNLGLYFYKEKQFSKAIFHLQKAIECKPDYSEAHHSMGSLLKDEGKTTEAIESFQKAINFKPDFELAHTSLGNIFYEKERFNEAKVCYEKAIQINSSNPIIYSNLACILKKSNKLHDAINYLKKAIELKPDYAEAYHELATLFEDFNNTTEVVTHYKKALECKPDFWEAYNNLGGFLQKQDQLEAAIQFYRKALEIKPNSHVTYYNLANTLLLDDNHCEATLQYDKALNLKPDYAEAYNNLGNCLKDQGRIPEAIESYRKSIQIKTDGCHAQSNLLFALNHDSSYSNQQIFNEHLRWAKQYETPLIQASVHHPNHRNPDRRLKIGYISSDFHTHINAYVIEPFLKNHDKSRFEIFCYAHVLKPDLLTEHLKAFSDHWHDIKSLSDKEASELVRRDQIDILVELTGHTGNNRLLLLAYQPAPIQVSYLGYVNTTGMQTIDYRLTDVHGDPPGMTDAFYTEKHIRLPETALCWEPRDQNPGANELPALSSRHITFGSANNLGKITPEAIELWSKILLAIPESRLIIKARPFKHQEMRERFLKTFSEHGIKSNQVELLGWMPGSHLEFFHRIDIHLDSFPFTGGMTSFESLWMGVPIITLAGESFVSRLALRHLAILGLHSWIASTPDQYIEIAKRMANNLNELKSLRLELRQMILCSPLTDGPRFTRNLEDAYRTMWRKWCGQPQISV